MDWAHNLLKVWKWLASKCVTEVNVNVAQGPYIHWSTVKHSAEKLQAASKKLVEGSRRVCSRRLWNIHGVTRTQSQTGLACLARLHNNNFQTFNTATASCEAAAIVSAGCKNFEWTRYSSAGSTVPKAPRVERSWWLQGSFCTHDSLQNAQPQPATNDAESTAGAGDQLLVRRSACLEHDQGAQFTSFSAVDGM